jgi:hypothetical protein
MSAIVTHDEDIQQRNKRPITRRFWLLSSLGPVGAVLSLPSILGLYFTETVVHLACIICDRCRRRLRVRRIARSTMYRCRRSSDALPASPRYRLRGPKKTWLPGCGYLWCSLCSRSHCTAAVSAFTKPCRAALVPASEYFLCRSEFGTRCSPFTHEPRGKTHRGQIVDRHLGSSDFLRPLPREWARWSTVFTLSVAMNGLFGVGLGVRYTRPGRREHPCAYFA